MRRVKPERVWFSASLAAAALVLLWLLSRNGPSDGSTPSDAGSPGSVPTTIATLATATPAATSLPESEAATTSASPAVPPPSAAAGELSLPELLALLGIASEQRTGYERDLFSHWSDEDGDGCNTRWEVLIAESMTQVSVGAGCSLSGGSWFSVYDGLTFVDPADGSIDHVVALAEAWDSGASGWTPQRREAFANDLGTGWELIAVSPASNSRKSDMDPADWLPDRPVALCDYLADWLAVKVRWGLAVDQREHDAIVGLSASCTSVTRPVILAVVGAPSGSSGATMAPRYCDPAYPTVCIPPSPPDLDCGDIAFRRFTVLEPDPHRFDGDHDGIGCEG